LQQVNYAVLQHLQPNEVEVELWRADELEVRRGLNSELDEMWSFVKAKTHPRWLWHAIDHGSGKVLAYVFGRRKDRVFLQLQTLLEPFGITRYYTDGWGAYERHLDADKHQVGKDNTQKIESKHINLRTRIKRLVRRTVVSLHLTDNSEVGTFGKIVSFRHRERGPHHGTAPVVLPTPPGRSRVDLPPHACLVA